MTDDWTKDIQRLMADREVKAPEGLLDDVKRNMPKRKVVPMWRYRWVAAAAVVAAIAVPVVWNLLPSDNGEIANMGTEVPSKMGNSTRNNVTEGSSLASAAPSINQQLASLGEKIAKVRNYLTDKQSGIVADTGQYVAMAEETAKSSENNGTVPPTVAKAGREERKKKAVRYYDEPLGSDYSVAKRSSGFTVNAYYGGSSSSGSVVGNGGQLVFADAVPYGAYNMDMASSNWREMSDNGKPKRKAHHSQPVKVGVSVGYRLSDRWSVNAGVTYSYLSSDFTAENMPTQSQKLHYVGVPVSASYSFIKGRKAEVYVTGGGEIEKLVKGTRDTESEDNAKVKEHRPQYSVKAAVGGAYHITPSVSVYAEPGVAYYFDNHSSVENIYKDKPTSFSLNVGLRVNINNK